MTRILTPEKQTEANQTNNPDAARGLRMVVPKKGRLRDDFNAILQNSGLSTEKNNGRLDFGTTNDTRNKIGSFETLMQRPADALANINDGLADLAVVGLDSFEEASCAAGDNFNVRIVCEFNGCSACGLWIAGPQDAPVSDPAELAGKRIVTSYPNILRNWLADNNVEDVEIFARDGGVEDYIRLGLADYVCDVVETGGTLVANGLTKQISIFNSAAVLVQRRGAWSENNLAQAAQVKQRLIESADTKLSAEEREARLAAAAAKTQDKPAAQPAAASTAAPAAAMS